MDDSPAERAHRQVAAARDDPAARLDLLTSLYEPPAGSLTPHLPYRRAASAFMRWQIRRGLLNPATAADPGSPWWRAVNERLLRDAALGRAAYDGGLDVPLDHVPLDHTAALAAHFAHHPSAATWYRAHNASVVAGYLEHRELAEHEGRVERFFLNLVLVRVLFAHALVAAPRSALAGWCAPLGPLVGDPRVGMTGLFLSLSRVLPATYPLGDDLESYVAHEHGFGRLLDVGIIRPRIRRLYEWSAAELDTPALLTLLDSDVPAYAWDPADDDAWNQAPSRLARAVRRVVPVAT